MKVKIINKKELFRGFLTLDQAILKFEHFDGSWSDPVSRLNIKHGDAAAILLYDSLREKIVLIRQFRYSMFTVEPDNSWPLEIVAGLIEKGSDPATTAVREAAEEVGYQIDTGQLEYLGRCFPSPGYTSERIYLYAADIAQSKKTNKGGGLAHEEEDIKTIQLSYNEAFTKMERGEISDAKSLIALYWFKRKCDKT